MYVCMYSRWPKVCHHNNYKYSNKLLPQISQYLLLEEAVASPSIENTLWCVSTMFARPAITPPEVNGFR